ncbi:MAG: glycosyltransferase family 39 protein [Paludisphaera borealis]|uniref:glycosyltransferase family 39 protein n=1 Tax=Paludisphaera borealis TaxID=1387353 RepID=UPI002847F152|nr:glycosyltransferase family 39 protein [Paludisphaera borealis]MDR3621790.1 glycosyltransferase family 39 protein [Paludisphaera borealis]
MSGSATSRNTPGDPPTAAGSPGRLRARRFAVAVGVGLATLAIMLAAEPRLAIVWDEGYTLGREARLRTWFRALRDPQAFAATWVPPVEELVQQVGAPAPRPDQVDTRSKLLFDPRVLAWFWPFAREEPHGHPPFYALLGLVGDVLAPTWQTLPRARLGPILLFSLCAGAVFHFVARRWGGWAAAVAAGAWVLQPNLFGHGHYAAYDGVLSALWLLAVFSFVAAVDDDEPAARRLKWLSVLTFGVILGCAMATKLTGWFLPIPFVVWAVLYRRRRAFWVLGVGLAVGFGVLLLLNLPWWTEPVTGLVRFFRSNLTRGRTIPIPVQFLGTIYQTPLESLPWYNTIVWTVLVTPVGFLILGLAGVYRAVARIKTEPVGLLILGHWLFLLALRAAPHTPGHDGVRLFLPAFGVLALLAGLGVGQIGQWLGKASRWIASASLAEGLLSVLVMMPTPLAYFSPIVVGLPGAVRLGMEPTYYWDGLDPAALAWLRDNTRPGQTIQFATFPTSWLYLRETGALPRRLAPVDLGTPVWYVLQNRPGAWAPWDRALVSRATPEFKVDKLGVPLVWIFPYRALQEAAQGR